MKSFLKNKIVQFLEYKKKVEGFSIESLRTYEINLKEAINSVDIEKKGDILVIELMPYRMKISSQNRKTIAKKISIFRSFIKFLQENSYKIKLSHNESIKIPKTLPKPIEKRYIFEVLKIADEEERLIVLLLYGLGLRISELSLLKIEDIKGGWIRVKGKGDKIRNIPLLSQIEAKIDEYLKKNRVKMYLFEKNGNRLSENSLRYRVQKVFGKIGIKVTPHQLRHSYASDILNEGGRINDVSMLLGHSSLSTTEIYTKLGNSYKLKNYISAHPLCKEKEENF